MTRDDDFGTGVVHYHDRPGPGARAIDVLLRLTRHRVPIDGHDPAAFLAVRAHFARTDARLARFTRAARKAFAITPQDWPGIAVDVIAPRDGGGQGTLLYLPGGGYFFRTRETHRLFAARLAQAAGASRAVMVLYRLFPEHPAPAALDDALAAWDALIAQGHDPHQIVLAGDSAGGGLALMMALRDRGGPLPRAAVLFSPFTDVSLSGVSVAENARADAMFGGRAGLPVFDLLCNGLSQRDPRVSPLFGNWHGLPPLYVQVGSTERLRDDALRMADPARAAGVDLRVEVWNAMPHVFPLFDFAEARRARAKAGRFLQRHLS